MRAQSAVAAVTLLALAALACVPAVSAQADPTYCLEYADRTFDCNCHTCNCQTCHTCTCETKKAFWSHCRYDSCGNTGCWCSPACRCCYKSDCRTTCNCETCCDTCTETTCSHLIRYSVHSVNPAFVAAAAPPTVTVAGGYFVSTANLQCKFGDTTVAATFVSTTSIRCTPPAQTVTSGDTTTLPVAVSLDGEHWTNGNVSLTFVACVDDCSGHGTCDSTSSCVCDPLYTGATCAHLCPTGTSSAHTSFDGNNVTCSGNGVCTQGGGCQCDDGYWGATCQNACPIGLAGHVCSGSDHGACAQDTGLCVCLPGFTGTQCQHAGTCQEHGTNCTCGEKGYWGNGCENTCPGSTECVEGVGCSTTCSDHGLCTAEGTCLCDAGFYGTDCASACPSANDQPCSGHAATGTCDVAGNCVCSTGWSGADCSMECPGGAATPCNNHGVCTSSNQCACSTGYVGDACQLECPVALGEPCAGHGSCTQAGTCDCQRGYWGDDCNQECPGGAATPCNGHGACSSGGVCECEFGYYGEECDSECAGGAATPCSNHGVCSSAGVCNCNIGYWGTDCGNDCPRTNGTVCSGHGTCGSDGQCTCNTPYEGTSCDTVFCPYDCYGHGSCDEHGICHCQGNWGGIYCSQETSTPVAGGAVFTFTNGYIRTVEDAGTIYLNVSRGGSTYGDVYVSYATADASAHADSDYLPTSGRLVWASGDGAPKTIAIDVLGDDHPEGTEAFTVYLYDPSPDSTVGSNATVAISANGDAVSTEDSVVVTLKILKPESQLRLTTVAGATFADNFIADICGPNVLDINTDRIIIRDVLSSSSDESFYTFVVLASDSGPSPDDLAETVWEQMHDATSALYAGTATRYIDMDYQPVFQFTDKNTGDSPTTYWWLLAVGIVLALLITCAIVAYRKRLPLTEWLLWRLGNMRFNSLMKHRNLDDLAAAAPADRSANARAGDDIKDDRL